MNKIKSSIKFYTSLILIIFTFILTGCNSQYIGKDRDSKWTNDIDFLASTLPNKHKNLFFKISKGDFTKEIDSLKKSVSTMNDDEVIMGIHKIVASVGDGHTACYPNTSKIYPMSLYWFKDGIYVNNTIDKYKNILYCKLVKINGKDIEEVKNSVSQIISHENDAQIKNEVPQYLCIPQVLHGLKITPNIDKVNLTFEDNKKNTFNVEMDSIVLDKNFRNLLINKATDSSKALYMQNADKSYWYKYLEDKKVLYFKYNSCMEDPNKPFKVFNKEILNFMNTHTVDKLVIDLRDNGGGDSSILNPFIDEIKKRNINDKNKLFVIIGRRTFSSAILNAIDFKNKTNATFVGEPTGGKPNHFGEVKTFRLPNSKMKISYSTEYFNSLKEDTPSFIPDKTVDISIDDYVIKKDPVLESIVK